MEENKSTDALSLGPPFSDWLRDPSRKVLLVDETRATFGRDHREFIVFTGVLIDSGILVGLLKSVDEQRAFLPEVSRDDSFKGRNLLHLLSHDQFRPIVMLVASALARPSRIFIAATTIKNVQESSAGATIRAANETGRPSTVRGSELSVALNFILRVGREIVGPGGQLDVVLDRSSALGLDPQPRKLPGGAIEAFVGPLAEGGPDFCILSDSDKGPMRDALLLPDFAGYLLVHKSADRMAQERAEVTGTKPFYFREVAPAELAKAVATHGQSISRT